jgi:hypothetical protein
MADADTVRECMGQIPPAALDDEEWLSVGMAAKDAGLSLADWDRWSAQDASRYRPREMAAKWESFRGSSSHPVGVGSIVRLCRAHGGIVATAPDDPGRPLDWDAVIGPREAPRQDLQVVRPGWEPSKDLPPEPNGAWDGRADLAAYLRALFDSHERVGIVTECWADDKDGVTLYSPK